jgi:aerobic carbon-monoxide dehydrogenase large subunit
MGYIGASLRRKEDARLLRGEGRFAADIRISGMLHAAIVRSPHAHAEILNIDAARALAAPGVAAVFGAGDLPSGLPPIPLRLTSHPRLTDCLQYPLARGKVRYAGEPIAVVVAGSRYAAEDAADDVVVRYRPLPAVVSVDDALASGAPILHEKVADNVACRFEARAGDPERAFRHADLIVEERFSTNRLSAVPLECRGVVADYDARDGRLTVFGAAKVPHFNRSVLARLLRLPESRVRMVEMEVGGGFGARGEFYPEDYLIPYVTSILGRPVGWVEDRLEHLVAINHSRQQEYLIRAALRSDGTILGLHARIDNDHGAYVRTHGAVVMELAAALLPGPYRIPNYLAEVRCVLTNKTPTGTYRGPGRYETTFVRERLIDIIARRLDMDPADVRRRNMIPSSEMPYDVGTVALGVPTIYDSGDYHGLLETALTAIDYAGVRATQTVERAKGRWLGVGIGAFVEKAGLGPWEYARVEVDQTGQVVLYTGGSSVGQGLVTVLSQITADALGVDPDRIDVVYGDTDRVPYGNGAFASRLTVVGGAAAHGAARLVRRRAMQIAADLMEVSPDDIDLQHGMLRIRGVPGRALSLADVARACAPGRPSSDAALPGLRAEYVYQTDHMTYPGGVHACVVEVDLGTGAVRIVRYAIAYDIGRAVNPMLVAGQLQGGLAQGIGGALLEDLVYSPDGQLLSGTLMDYLLPTIQEVPGATLSIVDTTPTPLNPLGAKGAGEGGCTGAGGCIANAVADALAPFGIEIHRLPLSPNEVLGLIRRAAVSAPR